MNFQFTGKPNLRLVDRPFANKNVMSNAITNIQQNNIKINNFNINNFKQINHSLKTNNNGNDVLNTHFQNIKQITIFTSVYTLMIAERFKEYFSNKDIVCKIINSHVDNDSIRECQIDKHHFLFIITPTAIIPKVDKTNKQPILSLPYKKYILYQTEQLNQPNITRIDNATLEGAYAIFDYTSVNLKYYNDIFKPRVKLIRPFIKWEPTTQMDPDDQTIDILFIGTLNERRKNILNAIQKWATMRNQDYRIEIVTNKFGEELDSVIRRSKLVINLHYYPNAILEVFRLHDLLCYDCRIISEMPQHHDELGLIQEYRSVIDFVPVIDGLLTNITPLLSAIMTRLSNNNWRETNRNINDNKSMLIYTLNNQTNHGLITHVNIIDKLFYKFYLGISNPDGNIQYTIIKNNITKNNNVAKNIIAHLHCYNISQFREIYLPYIEKIKDQCSIVVTYSIGDTAQFIKDINTDTDVIFHDMTILKIPNRGLDIGAKMCAMDFLKRSHREYKSILFLHSKQNRIAREKYFKPLIDNLDVIFNRNNETDNIDGYFPDIQWQIYNNEQNLKTITGNPEYKNIELPERNTLYRRGLLKYLSIETRTIDSSMNDIFIEGNCYILSKRVAEKVFGDPALYNILNTETSFDYNWVANTYKITGSVEKVYQEFKDKQLATRNTQSYDGYIEHAFERIILNCCQSYKLLTPENSLTCNSPLLNILIRTTYRPEYFIKCIHSILSQSYQNYKIIICYDDVKCLDYLYNYKNNSKIEIFEVKSRDRTSEAFYNLYCNELLEKVNNGWIMFLDDDDMFYSKQALETISKNLYTENDILFWKVKVGNHIIYPKNINNIIQFNITTSGFIFNHKFKNNAKWDNERCGDFRFITNLLENTSNFNRRFIDSIITSTQLENLSGLLGKKDFPDSLETFDQLVKYYNIKQIYISKTLHHVNDKVYMYNLTCKYTYRSLTDNAIVFFGLYTPEDIKLLYSLTNSNIFLLFGGSELENVKHILPIIPRIHIIAISKSIQDRLKNLNIESRLLTFNLTDKNIFYPRKSTDNCIYIYDGYDNNNPANEKIYGRIYYDEILNKFPKEKFIFSSQLNAKHEEMPEIYARCKIGLRLTSEDGNANTVQEFEAMNIPIVHNQSEYGLKWKTVDDIIIYINIYMGFDNKILKSNNNLCKKIYLIYWIDDNKAKGINIDCDIIYNVLSELNYNVFFLKIPLSYLKEFDESNNTILLDGDIYIFSEVCFSDIYDFILKNNKEIILMPNIDSYSTFKPIIADNERDFINSLKTYSKNNKFNIWCKTKQIYKWLNAYNFTNLHYIHFCYNIISSQKLSDYTSKILLNKKKEYILLDTGNSVTKRKYLEEILDIFIDNNDIPFTLLVKTTPKVYNKFLKNTKFVKYYTNIEIISELLPVEDLIHIYTKCKYFIYCSRFDGYGLSIAQAIKYNLFIFTLNGLPWIELLESYPRKCLINSNQDMSKSMGIKTKGKALSQIYYKCDFNDLIYKLKNNKDKYEKIISDTYEECQFVNKYNNKVFVGNIKNYFQKKYKICNIYNNTSIGVISYIDREKLFIENLLNIILQTNEIVIYLNSASNFIKTFLSNISNVNFKICDTDLKSLTKLKVINYLNNDVNLIIDDDIIYPSDYVEYTYNILKKQSDKKSFYSYNGYTDKFKYPFTIKTQLCLQDNCNLGSGTLFYNKDTLTDNKLEQFLEKMLRTSANINIQLFCDKTFLQFCQENKIKTKIISPKHTFWMINNQNMKYGLLEMKKELDIYDLKNVQTILFKDKLINTHNNLPNNILKFFHNKIDIINIKVNYFDYYQIYVKDNILYINDNVNDIININLNDESLFKKLEICVATISKLYNN